MSAIRGSRVGLDITNMVDPSVAFRMTELLNTTFDLLEDQISYVHAKDFAWNTMLPGHQLGDERHRQHGL